MNGKHRIVVSERPAAVDHFLAASLHLGVLALHRGEVEVFVTRPRGHRRSRATAKADQHRRPTEDNNLSARRNGQLVDMPRANIPHAAREHDGLVVAAHFGAFRALNLLFKRAEVAADIGPAEFIVERGAPDRPFEHDVEGRNDAVWFAEVGFPGLGGAGQLQVRNRIAGKSRLRLCAATGCAFVANFATGSSGCSGKGRNCSRVVVRFDLHQDQDRFFVSGVDVASRGREKTAAFASGHDRAVVGIGGQDTVG